MNKLYRTRWAEALSSGLYRPHPTYLQHSRTGRMNTEGVLCDILVDEGYMGMRWEYNPKLENDGLGVLCTNTHDAVWFTIPTPVQNALGINALDLYVIKTLERHVSLKTKTFPYAVIQFVKEM